MRSRRRYLWPAVVLGLALALLPAVASSDEAIVPLEAVNEGTGVYGTHRWSPAQTTVTAVGVVTLRNSTEIPHGVEWRSALKPSCEEGPGKVPVGTSEAASGTKWSGKCTFTQPGTYTFWCTVHHAAMSGTITVNGPTSTTGQATAVTEKGATLNGTVNPEGQTTSYFFKYGTTPSYGQTTSELPVGADKVSHPESAVLSGLSPGALYHYQLVAVFGSGKNTTLGADETFMTASPPGAPTVSTGQASAMSETAATLNGTVNPQSLATSYFFRYGTTTSYGQTTSEQVIGEDNASHSVSATLNGLSPETVYHFQVVAHNSMGTVPGLDHTFTTASPPPPPPPPPSPPPPSPPTSLTALPPTITPIVTPAPMSEESPLLSSSIKLAASQHGSSVRGAVEVSQAGAGGRLEVDLLASGASLAKAGHSAQTRIGQLLRSSLKAGSVPFSVPLSAKGKGALRRHRRLALTVRIVLTPVHGAAVTVTKGIVLHA